MTHTRMREQQSPGEGFRSQPVTGIHSKSDQVPEMRNIPRATPVLKPGVVQSASTQRHQEWLPVVLLPTIVIMLIITASVQLARAGGPKYVAGASYFNPNLKGTPLTWASGIVNYYTDQGNLSSTVGGPGRTSWLTRQCGGGPTSRLRRFMPTRWRNSRKM